MIYSTVIESAPYKRWMEISIRNRNIINVSQYPKINPLIQPLYFFLKKIEVYLSYYTFYNMISFNV